MAIPKSYRAIVTENRAADGPAPGVLETIRLSAEQKDRDEYADASRDEALRNAYDGVIAGLHQRGIGDVDSLRRNVWWRDVPVYDDAAIWKGVEAARKADPQAFADLPKSLDAFQRHVGEPFDREKAARAGQVSRGSGVAAFGGSMVSGLSDPINLPFMAMGVGEARSVAEGLLKAGALNAQIEAPNLAIETARRAKYGEGITPREVASDIGTAFVGGAAFHGIGMVGSNIVKRYRNAPDADLADHAEATIGRENMTTDERAAADVLRRESAIDASSPYAPTGAGDAAHRDQLSAAIRAVLGDDPPPTAPGISGRGRLLAGTAGAGRGAATIPRPALIAGDTASVDRIFDHLIFQESSGVVGRPGPATQYGTAHGLTQLLDGTGKQMAEKLGVPWQPELLRAKTPEGAAYQRQLGRAYFDEGLAKYGGDVRKALMYYHGGPSERLWRSKTHAYADAILSRSGGGNPHVDIAGGAGDDIAALDQRIADLRAQGEQLDAQVRASDAAPTLGDTIGEAGQAAPVAQPTLADPYAIPPMTAMQVPASRVTVDAGLMQFKEGGDANGVTDRLQGVTEWNPLLAGRQILWERNDGAMIVADGHQRVGLARRIKEKTGQDIPLDAIVLRERDGVTAGQARMLAAVKNIAEGTGSAIDAAKVIREGGPGVLTHLPPKSALVRDGAALAHLSPDSFGAVVNGVVKPEQGAAIGRLLPDDPASHSAMIDLLNKTKPANRTQAESILRDAIAAGFTDGEQTDMFGTLDTRASLFLQRAKVLDGAINQLKKLKSVFKIAGREADTLESGGVGTIDAGRAAQEANQNAIAIDLIERTASTHGPIKDAIDRAARALADGGKIGPVVDKLVKDLRGIDLRDALMVRDRAAAADAARSAQGPAEPAPALIDDKTLDMFGDPHGAGADGVRESLEHDLRADATAEPDAVGFRFAEEGPTVTRAALIEQIDAEDAAIKSVRDCL